jgi:hypothetical protein
MIAKTVIFDFMIHTLAIAYHLGDVNAALEMAEKSRSIMAGRTGLLVVS